MAGFRMFVRVWNSFSSLRPCGKTWGGVRGSLSSLTLVLMASGMIGPMAAGAETLFYDDFEDGKISDAFQFTGNGPKWVEEKGALSQTNKAVGDTGYAVIVDKAYPKILTIRAKLRVDEWETGAYARGGVGVRVADNGQGLAFLLSDHRVAKPQTGASFLNDHIAWGPLVEYVWKEKTWHWFQLEIGDKDKLRAKIWKDGEDEPKQWLAEIDPLAGLGGTRADGQPGLNASSGGGAGVSLLSFDSVEVFDEEGSTLSLSVQPIGKLATTWAQLRASETVRF